MPTGDPHPDRTVTGEALVPIESDADIVSARQRGRSMAADLGFTGSDLTLIATAISELTRNMLQYAGKGDVTLQTIENGGHAGLLVIARDEGPGIHDVSQALTVGYSTSGGLGLGLPGVRRLVDSFEIASVAGRGTVVTAIKWKR
jgi:serine/threonine-protein kinase RsbT